MDVEAYGDIGIFLGLAGIFISVIPFVLCVAYKKQENMQGYLYVLRDFVFLLHYVILSFCLDMTILRIQITKHIRTGMSIVLS